MKFKFDPNSTPNEGRWRLKDPKLFTRYFRRKSNTYGISFVMGIPEGSKSAEIQAIRFDKSVFDEAKAALWWAKNADQYEKVWTPTDWVQWKKEKK